jgi:hypothetical protein
MDDDEASSVAADAAARCQVSWLEAARYGPSHPELAKAAETCFDAALAACGRLGVDEPTADIVARYRDVYVARHRCPADDRLDEWAAAGDGSVITSREAPWAPASQDGRRRDRRPRGASVARTANAGDGTPSPAPENGSTENGSTENGSTGTGPPEETASWT